MGSFWPGVMLWVEDSGIGIPQEEQDKIFAMYYQVKDSHGGKPATGTGIGLAVSRRLAKSMGGDITVSSHPRALWTPTRTGIWIC